MTGEPRTGARGGWGRSVVAGLVAAAGLLAVLSLVPSGASGATRRIPGSVSPAVAAQARASGSRVFAGLRLHVTVTLEPRDPAALRAYARAVSTPGSPVYRHYLEPAQFARRFGASPARVRAVRASLRARGLRPGPTSAGGLSVPLTATAAELQRGLRVSLRRLHEPGRGVAVAATAAPSLPARAAAGVQSVIGLGASAPPRPLAVRARVRRRLAHANARALAATAGPQPCAAAQAAAPSQGAYTENAIASAYGFPGLYAAGDGGAGTTIAVYELEPNDPSDIAAFQACYGTAAPVSYVPVDGGAGRGAGSDEAALDIENLIGFAPQARLLVYQGPNSSSGAPGSGPYDTFSAIVNQDRAQVVSVSWGQCEAQLGAASAAAEHALFQQAAVQGQSIVAAAGDNGAQDCDTTGTASNLRPAVDDPAAQPFVTAVGGTTLRQAGPPPLQTAWNSGGSLSHGLGPGASGGGVSTMWPMPASQLDAGAALGVRSPAAAGSHCAHAHGFCREIPDVSADADPTTGYLVYFNGAGSDHAAPAGWQGLGGTSAAAPVWAALLALADASPACHGVPLGYANPALYRAATDHYAADFHDVTTGNNDFTGTNGGRFAAKAGYDPVTGLGTPNAAALVGSLCADSVTVHPFADQRSAVHAAVAVRVRAGDVPGARLTYFAFGLPGGLRLDAATGRIAGRLTRRGRFAVRLGARDSAGASAQTTLTWTVGPAPRVSHASLSGSGTRTPRLTFTVTAGRSDPPIRALWIRTPLGLRIGSGHGVAVLAVGAAGPATSRVAVRVAHDAVSVAAEPAVPSLRVTLGPPALVGAGARRASSARRAGPGGSLTVQVGAGTGTSRVVTPVRGAGR